MKGVCSTCLNQRLLKDLQEFQAIYKLILPEVTGDVTNVKLCCKCVSVLRLCHKFRTEALRAQTLLNEGGRSEIMNETKQGNNDKPIPPQERIDYLQEDMDKSEIRKQIENMESTSATCVKIEIQKEIEIEVPTLNSESDPLVNENDGDKEDKKIDFNPKIEKSDDDDTDNEVLSKVTIKIEIESADETDSNEKEENMKFKMATSEKEREKTALIEIPSVIPTEDEILKMFTSIEFCKNQFNVDGDKVEVLIMSEQEMRTRRLALSEDATYLEASHRCEHCILLFESQQQLENHNAISHLQRPNETKCQICSTYVPHQIFKHHYGRHRVMFRCRVCLYCDDVPTKLLSHLSMHSEAKVNKKRTYNCVLCNIKFPNSRNLRLHREKLHELDKREYECGACDKKFESHVYYRDHMRRHGEKPVPCKLCDKVYMSYSALNYHMKSHTSGNTEVAYCVECDTQFKNELLYKMHLKNHPKHRELNNSKLHWCAECGQSFSQRAAFRDHVDIRHRNLRRHECTDCGKLFGRIATLRAHRRHIHEGAPPPKDKICTYCGRGFASNKTLEGHINTHTGVRPFTCEECGDTFRQSAALFTHRKLVHRKRNESSRRAGVMSVGSDVASVQSDVASVQSDVANVRIDATMS